jgi:hypothetical protein
VSSAPVRHELRALALRAWVIACMLVRWAAPRLRTAGRHLLAGAGHAAATAVRHRAAIAHVLTRAAWWSALWLWFVGGRAFFDLQQPLDGSWLAPRLIGGFVLCLVVLSLATERRMRWAGWILGLGHGALGLLALTLFGA